MLSRSVEVFNVLYYSSIKILWNLSSIVNIVKEWVYDVQGFCP